MSEMRIKAYDNKYTFISRDDESIIRILRYSEDWLVIDRGCNAILALMTEFNDARIEIERLRAENAYLQAQHHDAELAIAENTKLQTRIEDLENTLQIVRTTVTNHFNGAGRIVATWPEWKQNIGHGLSLDIPKEGKP